MDESSVPQFPQFIERSPSWRVLSCWLHEELFTEAQVSYPIVTFEELIASLFELRLLLFVPDLANFSFLDDLIHDYPNSKVMTENRKEGSQVNPRPINVKIKRGNQTRWIVEYKRWPVPFEGQKFLEVMREVYTLCKVGTPSTPGSLGQALMRKSWYEQYGEEWQEHRHSVPSSMACSYLHNHMTGGRVDTPGLGRTYDTLLELDLSNAYAAHYSIHPTGTAQILNEKGTWSESLNEGTWFARCEVEITRKLALGPFPVRSKEHGTERVCYPTEPGRYETFLWKEQAEDCRKLQCSVRVFEGYAWSNWTRDNSLWVAVIESLRTNANTAYIAACIKSATVSGIGRHGMSDVLSYIVPEEQAPDDADYLVGPGGAYAYFVVSEQLPRQANMVHWYSYTMMMCARTLYWYALPYAEQEHLVATNYDALYLSTWGDEMERYRPKSSPNRESGKLYYILHGKSFVKAPRTIKRVE